MIANEAPEHIKSKILTHWSIYQIDELFEVLQEPNTKPTGLWLSFDDSWIEWATSSEFYLNHKNNFKYKSQFKLSNNANVLFLFDKKQVIDFCNEFWAHGIIPANYYIDWHGVSKKYDGIVLIGVEELKKDFEWLNGWHCDSACFWNPTKCLERIDGA